MRLNMTRSQHSPINSSSKCRICNNGADNVSYRVREMLHGTREVFDYFQCGFCGCLQMRDIPADLSNFYPDNYYSFRSFKKLSSNRVRSFIDQHRAKAAMGTRNFLGWIANRVARPLDYVTWMMHTKLGLDAKILDVGCGHGKLLLRLTAGGFQNCTGLDPFIPETLRYPNGPTIFKTTLESFSARQGGEFDLIMFHHSLEHVRNPLNDLRMAASLLSDKGWILVAIPVADCVAWEQYRESWVNLDAPRHLHVLTRKSMGILAGQAGLVIDRIDSLGLISQFTGSELYRRDIPGNVKHKLTSHFSRHELSAFRRRTHELNKAGQGDIALFYLRQDSR